jgi:hypothetical protein
VGEWLAVQGSVWGEEVVGTRLAVYWTDDEKFYPGHVIAFKAATGEHKVSPSVSRSRPHGGHTGGGKAAAFKPPPRHQV